MNVLLFPPTHGSGLGVQFRETATALESLGVAVEVAAPAAAPRAKPDVAHLLDAPDVYAATASLMRARALGLPIVISPVYWDPDRFYAQGLPEADPPQGPGAAMEQERREAARAVERAAQVLLFRRAAVLLAQSPGEAALLQRDFAIPPERISIAPPGVRAEFWNATSDAFHAAYGLRDFVFCAARVEIRKNQLTLVRALRQEPLTLVFAGETLAPGYQQLCVETAAGGRARVVFLPSLDPALLASAYAAARVHALASWYDCVALTPLEAAAGGCAIALSSECGARDYLLDDAFYFEPGDPAAAREAVHAALNTPPPDSLRARLADACTWARTGEQTRAAYAQAQRLGNPDETGYAADLEQLTAALACLARLQEQAHAALWREKTELGEMVRGYASGRVMRLLNALGRGARA